MARMLVVGKQHKLTKDPQRFFAAFDPGRWDRRKVWDILVKAARSQWIYRVPDIADVHRWLDERDGFPVFSTLDAASAYVAHREEDARALLALLTLDGFRHETACRRGRMVQSGEDRTIPPFPQCSCPNPETRP